MAIYTPFQRHRTRGAGEKADNHLTKKNIGPSSPRLAPISKVPGDTLLLVGAAALCFGPHPPEWVGIRVVRLLHISSLVSLHAMCVLLSAQGFYGLIKAALPKQRPHSRDLVCSQSPMQPLFSLGSALEIL